MDGLLPAESAVEASASGNGAPMVRRPMVLFRRKRWKALSNGRMDVRPYAFGPDARSRTRLLPCASISDAYRGRRPHPVR